MSASEAAGTNFDIDFLSPSQRSCVNIGKTEPCVKKAVHILKRLKDQVQHKVKQTCVSGDRHSTSIPIHSTSSQEDLCIEGRATGTQQLSSMKEEAMRGDLDWDAVIAGILNLVIRIETDRQETLQKLSEEKEKVHHLNQRFDVESKRRLCLLEDAVQAEHERSVDELKELQLVVEKERRELTDVLCDLSVTDAKHSQLRKEEAELMHNSSLLDEKISDEKQKIDHIKQHHKETAEKVVEARKTQTEIEDQLLFSQKKADADLRERKCKLTVARTKLQRTRDALNDAELKNKLLQSKAQRFQQDIEEADKRILECEVSASEKSSEFKDIHSEVCDLKEVYNQLAMKNKQAEDHNLSLEAEWLRECETIEGLNAGLRTAIEETQHKLQELKDKREDVEQDIGRIKEEISLCKKQQEDDKKTVERGKSEVVRLEKQLEVSTAQFTKLQRLNHELSQRLEELKAQTGSEEYKYKMTIQSLQRKIRENDVATRHLEVQEKESREICGRLQLEVEAVTKKLKSSIEHNTAVQKGLNGEVKELEITCAKQKESIQHLQKEISTVKQKHDTAKQTVGVEVKELERVAMKLQNDLDRKIKTYEDLRSHEELLQDRIKELDKATASTHKLKCDVEAENEELQQTVDELSDRLSREKDDVSNLEQELKDITEFREEAQKKFLQYTEEREQHLNTLQANLHSSMAHNALMRRQYECAQGEYLAIKSKMLGKLEKEGDTSVATTEMQQLEYVQSGLSSCLRKYLEYRSSAYTNKLHSCQAIAEETRMNLSQLHCDVTRDLTTCTKSLEDQHEDNS